MGARLGRPAGLRWALPLLLWGAAAPAAVEGPGRTQFIHAARTDEPIAVDGRLAERAWEKAPPFTDFVERFPAAGQPPSERTELRVLYDDRYVYFGITCRDSEPDLVNANLGRRDSPPFSDSVEVLLDTMHDHRTAYDFGVTAGGSQFDGLFYDDNLYTSDWDGVWDAAAARTKDGWVAELAIPLSLLRFPDAPSQTWGFSVRRRIARKNEEMESVDNPRTTNATVSRLGHLTGIEGLAPRRAMELVPYLAARLVARPQYSDAARPQPRLTEPSLDLGLDYRAAITPDLAFTATVNPDFGQVEADKIILNLSTFELFFPEKRPFFLEGLSLFKPVSSGSDPAPQTLFYSRRIGLETPIFGAAKLSGSVGRSVEVGVLDAVVAGPWQASPDEDRPDPAVRLHLERPLHLAPEFALSTQPLVPMNYLAAVVRGKAWEHSRVGATVTAATPLTGTCGAVDPASQGSPACLANGGNAAALDVDLRTADGQYGLFGQVDGSQTAGGPPERVLKDGTRLGRGDLGAGGYLYAGKFGGEGVRWDVSYSYASPTLELNPSGFQSTQNEHATLAGLRYQRDNGFGALRAFSANLEAGGQWTADGRYLHRGNVAILNAIVTLASFDTIGLEAGGRFGGWDVRELNGTGVPLELPRRAGLAIFGNTNPGRPVSAEGVIVVRRHLPPGPLGGRWEWTGDVLVNVRPHPALETRLEVDWEHLAFPARFVEDLGGGGFVLGSLASDSLSLTARQQWVLAPRLTLQGYAQLFTAYGVYGPFFRGDSGASRAPIRFADLVPLDREDRESFHDAALSLSLVLRLEYRLGSTLSLVVSHGQRRLPVALGDPVPRTLLPVALWDGPATDALLFKWAWRWDL